jgi:hypothetical protein
MTKKALSTAEVPKEELKNTVYKVNVRERGSRDEPVAAGEGLQLSAAARTGLRGRAAAKAAEKEKDEAKRKTAATLAASVTQIAKQFGVKESVHSNRIWSDQAWLISHPDSFFHEPKDFNFPSKNSVAKFSIRYSEHARLNNHNVLQQFLALTPAQLSLLQPHFKLERLEGSKSVPYSPQYHQPPRNIGKTKNKEADKLEFTSIESVSIERLEKYKEEVNLRISMKFFASSYKAFSTSPPSSDPKKPNAALIDFLRRNLRTKQKQPDGIKKDVTKPINYYADIKPAPVPSLTPEAAAAQKLWGKMGKPTEPKSQPLGDTNYMHDHTMRLTIGWSTPPGKQLKALSDRHFLDKASRKVLTNYSAKSKITLYGTLLHHEMDIQSDGSINLTIDFLGLLDSFFADPRGNALFMYNSPAYTKMRSSLKKIKTAATTKIKAKHQEEYKAWQNKYISEAYTSIYKQIVATNKLYATTVPWRSMEGFYKRGGIGETPSRMATGPQYKVSSKSIKYAENTKPKVAVGAAPNDKTDGYKAKRIEYFSLGTLINVFITNSLDKIYGEEDKLFKHTRFRFGDIVFIKPSYHKGKYSGKLMTTNIGAIPVAFSTFQSWFTRYISGKGVKIITLRTFLFDLIQNLVDSSFTNFKFVKESTSLYKPKFNMYGTDRMCYITANNVGLQRSTGRAKMYAKYPRFILGGSQAVVTGFSFSKVNMAGFAEAQMYAKNVQATGIAREVYNVVIDIVGNPLFENGMYIVVDPSGFVPRNRDSIQLGLGGLYVIKKVDINWKADSFSTRLEAIYEAPLPATPLDTFSKKITRQQNKSTLGWSWSSE